MAASKVDVEGEQRRKVSKAASDLLVTNVSVVLRL